MNSERRQVSERERETSMTTRIHSAASHSLPHVIVPGSRVRQSAELAPVGVPRQVNNDGTTVELVKEGDLVRAIDVTCACGQKIRVWCAYESE